MVNNEGQLYTIEGIAASLILLVTAYFVLGSTTVYSPGESHVTDLQLEQIASDTLLVLDTPWVVSYTDNNRFTNAISPLENFTRNITGLATLEQKRECAAIMHDNITYLLNRKVNIEGVTPLSQDTIYYNLTCICESDGTPCSADFPSIGHPIPPRQNLIRVTRLVNRGPDGTSLMEMRIWRN